MADENRPEDPRPVSGELMPTNRNIPDVTTRNPLRRLFDQLFHLPIWNRRQKKAYEAQREMVEEATKLGSAIIDHQRQQGRLLDLPIILGTDRDQRWQERFEARNRLNDAKLEHKAWIQKQEIAKANKELEVKQAELKKEYELKRQELEYKKSIAQLRRQVAALEEPIPAPARTRTRGRSEKQKKIDRPHKRLEKELEKIESMTATPERKEALRRSARRELEEELERIENTPQP
jgi:hypothetical protein